jgi:predicted nucleotidyltransferase
MPPLQPNELEALKKLREALTRDFRLIELRLFGSKARGDSGPESDVDVLIILSEYDWRIRHKVHRLCFEIGLEHDVVLCPILYSQHEFASDVTRTTPFYQNVQREGIRL